MANPMSGAGGPGGQPGTWGPPAPQPGGGPAHRQPDDAKKHGFWSSPPMRVVRMTVSVILLLVILFVIWPPRWGGFVTVARVVGTSMEPVYHTGDVVIAIKKSDYEVGDTVVYLATVNSTSGYIVHKIVQQNPDGTFKIQGVNKAAPDPWDVPESAIRGSVRFLIPNGARVLAIFQNIWFVALMIGLLVTAIFWPSTPEDEELEEGPTTPSGPRHRRP